MNRIFFKCLAVWLFTCFVACSYSQQPYFFVHMSDTQLGMLENNAGFAQESEMVARTVSEINRLNPAFVVITGDLVNREGDKAQIDELKRLLAQVKKSIPVYYVPGNHDVGASASDDLLALYRSNFDYDRFSVLHNNTRLIGFNSQLLMAQRDAPEQEQFQWIENELKKSTKNDHRLVFAHHPLFMLAVDEMDLNICIPAQYRRKYVDLFNKYNVQYMFAGHLHLNHIARAENVTMIVTTSVCASRSSEPPGIRIVKVYPDKLSHDFYSLESLPAKIEL